jgi:hypothetical protein
MDLVNEKCVLATFGKIGNTSKNPPPSSSSCAREEGGETVEVDETRLTMKEQPANGTLFFVRSRKSNVTLIQQLSYWVSLFPLLLAEVVKKVKFFKKRGGELFERFKNNETRELIVDSRIYHSLSCNS